MLTYISYMEQGDGICVCRCFGEGSYAGLPSYIAGRPVRTLADHVFAPEPSFALRHVPKKLARRGGDPQSAAGAEISRPAGGSPDADPDGEAWILSEEDLPGSAQVLAAADLTEVVLPPTLRGIGDYAFYGCRNLKRVTMGADLSALGGGAFVAANHLEELVFTLGDGGEGNGASRLAAPAPGDGGGRLRDISALPPMLSAAPANPLPDSITPRDMADLPPMPAIRQALSEISYEVEVCVTGGSGELLRLHFPEYYEDAVENTPARIFEMRIEGTGYKYRQCFTRERPDPARYDSLFYEAGVQEFPPTVLRIAADRLLFPLGLSPDAKDRYLAYIREDPARFAGWCFSADRGGTGVLRLLRLLGREEAYDESLLEACLERAMEKQDAEAVSFLEDYRRKHFARRRAAERYAW